MRPLTLEIEYQLSIVELQALWGPMIFDGDLGKSTFCDNRG